MVETQALYEELQGDTRHNAGGDGVDGAICFVINLDVSTACDFEPKPCKTRASRLA